MEIPPWCRSGPWRQRRCAGPPPGISDRVLPGRAETFTSMGTPGCTTRPSARAGEVEMVGVQAIRALQVVVGPVVHPQSPVEVARSSGDLVQPHPELRRWHARHRVPICAPRGLDPEGSSRRGAVWIAVPTGDDEVEDLLRRAKGHGIPIGQVPLHIEQPHPFVIVVEEVCAAAVGADSVGGIARQSCCAPCCVPMVFLACSGLQWPKPSPCRTDGRRLRVG